MAPVCSLIVSEHSVLGHTQMRMCEPAFKAYRPAIACTVPETVNMLFLRTLRTQQPSTEDSTVAAIRASPPAKKASPAFQGLGNSSDGIDSELTNGAQLSVKSSSIWWSFTHRLYRPAHQGKNELESVCYNMGSQTKFLGNWGYSSAP